MSARPIPVENIYYLVLYACDALDQRDLVRVSDVPETRVVDLFVRLLSQGVARLLRRGLDRGYVAVEEEGRSPRGRFLVDATVRRASPSRASVMYAFDELRHDVLHNRILRATLDRLSTAPDLTREATDELASVRGRLHSIEPVRLTASVFSRVQLHGNIRAYRFLLDVCRLVFEHLIPNERAGETTFREFDRDPRRMALLFERFVRSFYDRESGLAVRHPSFRWDAQTDSGAYPEWLPKMQTDLSVDASDVTLIVDTKWYGSTVEERWDVEKAHAGNVYQMSAYLRAAARRSGTRRVAGLLLYPRVDRDVTWQCRLEGHRLSVRTIDLSRPWPQIHASLLSILANSMVAA